MKSDPDPRAATDPARARADARRRRIAEVAYHRAERRGFAPGHEEEDWLAAEKEVDASLRRAPIKPEDNSYPAPK